MMMMIIINSFQNTSVHSALGHTVAHTLYGLMFYLLYFTYTDETGMQKCKALQLTADRVLT